METLARRVTTLLRAHDGTDGTATSQRLEALTGLSTLLQSRAGTLALLLVLADALPFSRTPEDFADLLDGNAELQDAMAALTKQYHYAMESVTIRQADRLSGH